MPVLDEVLAANDQYASSFGDKSELALPPARGFAILTCMDARLDPAKYAGLSEGDAHVIRNAGGRASDDAIRSLVISYKLLGTRSGSSSITRTAAWSSSPTTSCAGCSSRASRPRQERARSAARKGFAILTCMDARLDPAKYAGLREGDAHVIRNAGGAPAMTPFDRS